ncbi:MAG: hypothetical protein ABI178_15640 [Rhodanobacter sp.]
MNKQGLRAAAGRWFGRRIAAPLEALADGRARLKIFVLLACVLALQSANTATVVAVAMQLEHALHIGNVQGWSLLPPRSAHWSTCCSGCWRNASIAAWGWWRPSRSGR